MNTTLNNNTLKKEKLNSGLALPKVTEAIVRPILFAAAVTAVIIIILIGFFILQKGWPVLSTYGLWNMISGTVWQPTKELYGILPMITGTFYITFIALVIGIPFGLATAIYLAEIAGSKTAALIRPAIELLAAIPSVIYGLFGMVVINALMRHLQRGLLSGILPPDYQLGYSVLSGGIVLSIMILPTIINIVEDALKAVPHTYKEAAFALGSTHIQTIFKVLIPAAKSGIVSAVMLAMGRAIGETMALIMVIGNVTALPEHGLLSLFAPSSSLTATIALEMGYAGPEHQAALFAVGIVLFGIIALLNAFVIVFTRRGGQQQL